MGYLGHSINGIAVLLTRRPRMRTSLAFPTTRLPSSTASGRLFKANRHKNTDGSVNLIYDDPTAPRPTFSGPVGLKIGSRNNLRGPGASAMDAGLAKTFRWWRTGLI